MSLSKQLSPLVFLVLFIFPLQHASSPKKCSSSYSESYDNTCGRFGIPIRFPLCDHKDFNLRCNDLNKTVLDLPFSGTFLVTKIDYIKQKISINDPEDCFVKRLLTFNTSGSPFSPRFSLQYTFLKPSWYPPIRCLSNSTSSFFATSNLTLANSMLPSCQIVKRVAVPVNLLFENDKFATLINIVDVVLEWSSPNCKGCEMDSLRCNFKNKASLEVKCFADNSGHLRSRLRLLIITLCIIGGITATFIAIHVYNSERFVNQRRQNAAIAARTITQQPRGVVDLWSLRVLTSLQ